MDEQLFERLGDRFVELGLALKCPSTPITHIAKLAFELGLVLQVRIVPQPPRPPNGFAGIPPVVSAGVKPE